MTHLLRRLAPAFALLLLAFGLAECRRVKPVEAPRAPSTPLRIIYTADTAGALDPCG